MQLQRAPSESVPKHQELSQRTRYGAVLVGNILACVAVHGIGGVKMVRFFVFLR